MDLSKLTAPTLDRPRQEAEVNAVNSVAEAMAELGYGKTNEWLNSSEIVKIKNDNSDLQRFVITRDLRVRLGRAPVDTSIERFALEGSTSMDDWLENLKKYVIPALIKIET